jgi:hypothetical protein
LSEGTSIWFLPHARSDRFFLYFPNAESEDGYGSFDAARSGP